MARFRDVKGLQNFAAAHSSIHNHFNQERHLYNRENFKLNRSAALAEWRQLAALGLSPALRDARVPEAPLARVRLGGRVRRQLLVSQQSNSQLEPRGRDSATRAPTDTAYPPTHGSARASLAS